MASLSDTILAESRRLACAVLSSDTAAGNFLGAGLRLTPTGSVIARGLGALRDNGIALACDPSGPDSRPGDMLEGLPSQPGQCPTLYDISGTYEVFLRDGGDSVRVSPILVTGITGPLVFDDSTENVLTVIAEGGTGRVAGMYSVGNPAVFGVRNVDYETTRQDGQPDNCGVSQDGRPRYEGPVSYEDSNGNPVTEDVTIVLDNPDDNGGGGGLTIPFGWFAPSVEINPRLNLDLEPDVELGPGGGCSPRVELPEFDLPATEDDPPLPTDTRRLVGVIVSTTVLTPESVATVVGDGTPPSLYLPSVGTVLFGVSVGTSRAWAQPTPITVLKQWVSVDGDIPAYTFRVINRLGFESTVSPVYIDQDE